jgi:hypothetical protein
MARRKQSKPSFGPAWLPFDPRKPRTECFLLCDYARSENGKLYIVGGGWNDIVPQQLPFDFDAYLAMKLNVPLDLLREGVRIQIELLDRQGVVLGDPVSEVTLTPEPFEEMRPTGAPDRPAIGVLDFLMASGVQMKIAAPGRFYLRLQVNGETLAGTSFVVNSPGGVAEGIFPRQKLVVERSRMSPTIPLREADEST